MNIIKIDRLHDDDTELEVDLDADIAYLARTALELTEQAKLCKARELAAISVRKVAEARRDGLIEKMQSRVLEYIEANAKGKAKYAELNLESAYRPEITVRFSRRAMQDKVEVTNSEVLLESCKDVFELVPQHYKVDKLAVNNRIKAGETLPGVTVTAQPARASLKEV